LDIATFVDPAEIDPRFYEKSYFIVPGKGGDKGFAILRDAMSRTGSVGIGRIIIHRRQHLAAIRSDGKALVLLLMRFGEELVASSEYGVPDHVPADSPEIRIASQLVESMRSPFDPSQFVDEYEENLKRIISGKAQGREVSLPGPAAPEHDDKIVDLMNRLRESLEGAKGARAVKEKKAAARRSTPRKRKSA
ncbi:MAG TPA: Ku protein, partial [Gemmatimonadaceae bacterium]|nr:Ku protein [Gemmatimonadaceae bacterium]